MANKVMFTETTSAQLDQLPIVNGRLTFTTDTQWLYRDINNARVLISGSPPITAIAQGNTLSIDCANRYITITVDNNNSRLNFSTK